MGRQGRLCADRCERDVRRTNLSKVQRPGPNKKNRIPAGRCGGDAARDCNRSRIPHYGDFAVTYRCQVSSTNSLRENPMLTKYSSESPDSTDQPYDVSSSDRALVALLSDGRIRNENVASSGRPELGNSLFTPARADRDSFLIESFALHGSSEHPAAISLVESFRVQEKAAPNGGGHRNALTSFWKTVAIRWVHWRRERGIEKTASGVAEFDDLTLREIGFPDQSRMQQSARYDRNRWI